MPTHDADVDQSEAERRGENDHRQRRRVAEAELLEQRVEGVERYRLGRGDRDRRR